MKTKNSISKELIRDIVEWDVGNWWRAIDYWEKTRQFDDVAGKTVLDLGGRAGGLSLYWAAKKICILGGRWRYVQLNEIGDLTKEFAAVEFQAIGFWGVFGKSRWLSEALGIFDKIADKYVKPENRYIVSCVCSKGSDYAMKEKSLKNRA